MQNPAPSPDELSFGVRLSYLRRSLSDADPLAAPLAEISQLGDAATARDADALATIFRAAPPDTRATYLLRALDDAIVALDLSAQLADEWMLTPGAPLAPQPRDATGAPDQPAASAQATTRGEPAHPAAPAAAPQDPLYDAYRAFAASQPALQALYHYRNALATRLRLAPREVPLMAIRDGVGDVGDVGE